MQSTFLASEIGDSIDLAGVCLDSVVSLLCDAGVSTNQEGTHRAVAIVAQASLAQVVAGELQNGFLRSACFPSTSALTQVFAMLCSATRKGTIIHNRKLR